jgi:hypothetical protein
MKGLGESCQYDDSVCLPLCYDKPVVFAGVNRTEPARHSL